MVHQFITKLGNDFTLAALDFLVEEFDDLTGIEAHHVIVVRFLRHLKHRVPAVEIVPLYQAGRLELGQDPVDGGQPDIFTGINERFVDVLGTHMPVGIDLQDLEDTKPWQGCLEARSFEFLRIHEQSTFPGQSLIYRIASSRPCEPLCYDAARRCDRDYDAVFCCQPRSIPAGSWQASGPDTARQTSLCKRHFMRRTLLPALLIPILLGGCAAPRVPFYQLPSLGDLPFVHKIDVQQGNVITQEMVAQLRKGMEKKKVQFIMGTPIIVDTFNADRWDYIYTSQHRGGKVERRHVTLIFADEKLARVDGGVKPAAGEIEIELHNDTTVDVPKGRGRGMMARIKGTIPFTGDKEEKPAKDDQTKQDKSDDKAGAAVADSALKARDKPVEATKVATTDKPASVAVPEDPEAEKAAPAPLENPYENIQSAPGEGIVVPPDAPRMRHKKGLATRFFNVFGLGEGDYVEPTPPEKPQEPLVKRPEPEE